MVMHTTCATTSLCSKVRAVCLGPASVMDLHLARACRDYVASVVFGSDFIPRVSVHSFSHFVHEVARASAIKQVKIAMPFTLSKGSKRIARMEVQVQTRSM